MVQMTLNLEDNDRVTVTRGADVVATKVRNRAQQIRDYTDTRRAAYESILPDLNALYALVVKAMTMAGPMGLTPDECAARLGLSRLMVRPRFTELKKIGILEDTGERRANRSRKPAKVLALVPYEELPARREGRAWKKEVRTDLVKEDA